MFKVAHFTSSWWSNAFGPETVTYTKSIKSTQSQAKDHLLSECSDHGHLFITGFQTNGKGRGTNTWISPTENTAFLGSILQRATNPPQPILTPLFGWAVYKALKEAFPKENWSIKAPNDIYLNDKKVAGLLLDSISQGDSNWIIFGLGVNVFESPHKSPHKSLNTNNTNNTDNTNNIGKSTSFKEEGVDNVNEDSWVIFLKTLSSNLKASNQMSLNKDLKPSFIKEITKGLKNYSENCIKTLSPNADLILDNETIVSWKDL